MVWQLLASVVAHPLPAAMSAHVGVDGSAIDAPAMMSSDCPHHHAQQLQSAAQTDDHRSGHACHAVCKCPCAGTAALMSALPSVSVAVSDSPVMHVDFYNPPLAPVANLLRPPII
jgi:hypothetical protein